MTTECYQLFSFHIAEGESGGRGERHSHIQYALTLLISKCYFRDSRLMGPTSPPSTGGRQECGTANRAFGPSPGLWDPVQGAIDASTQCQAEEYSHKHLAVSG